MWAAHFVRILAQVLAPLSLKLCAIEHLVIIRFNLDLG